MSEAEEVQIISQAAVLLGRRRMASLTAEGRSELGSKGAAARWGNTKMNYEEAQVVRQRVAAGESRRALAAEYGVCLATIGSIVRNKRYIKK